MRKLTFAAGIVALAALIAVMTTATRSDTTFTREPGLDRSGDDLRKDILAPDATVDECAKRCGAEEGCVAFTFVKKSTTVPAPICWLKKVVPVGYPSDCCISGVRQKS